MNGPLPTILLTGGSSGPLPGQSAEVPSNQSVSNGGNNFTAVLGDAFSEGKAASADHASVLADTQDVLGQLQQLPQGGKLLPLLRQVLVTEQSTGENPRVLLQKFSQDLQVLERESGLSSAESALAVLSSLAESLAPAAGTMMASARVQDTLMTDRGPAQQKLLKLMEQQLAIAEKAEGFAKSVVEGPDTELKNSVFERGLLQSQVVSSSIPRPAEFDHLIASLIRRTGAADRLPGAVEFIGRPESVLSAIPAASSPAGQPLAVPAGGASASASLNINVPFDQANWDQAMSERVHWMVGQKVQTAHIRLNPQSLGPMEVKLNIQNDQASVQFTSAHGVVREALDAAIPRLREMLDASGVELVNVDISGHSFARQEGGEGPDQSPFSLIENTDGSEAERIGESPVSMVMDKGRLDLFV